MIDEILIVSDVDNTLLTVEEGIPDVNITAIKDFTARGGRFTVATGRSVDGIRRAAIQCGVNCPIVVFNGSAVYDLENEKFIWSTTLHKSFYDDLVYIYENTDFAGIFCHTEEGLQVVRVNEYAYKLIEDEKITYELKPLVDVNRNMFKILFSLSEENMEKMAAITNKLANKNVRYARTNKHYYEMIPTTASKSEALRHLCKYLGVKADHLCAVGDYFNDEDMLREAAFAGCPKNAPQEIKELCDVIVADCRHGAVAEFIRKCEERYNI